MTLTFMPQNHELNTLQFKARIWVWVSITAKLFFHIWDLLEGFHIGTLHKPKHLSQKNIFSHFHLRNGHNLFFK
jgi:hypothetical protein